MLRLNHPFILRCFGLYHTDDKGGYVSELPRVGTVAEYVRSDKPLTLELALSWARKVCDALLYVSSLGIHHHEVSRKCFHLNVTLIVSMHFTADVYCSWSVFSLCV